MSRVMKVLRSAESEVERLEAAVTRWTNEAEAKRQELADLEARAGDEVLADETGTAARRLAVDAQELRFSIDGALAAAQAAGRQLQDARWALALAQAAEKRQEAGKLTARADAHQAKVDDLLAQLKDLDGVDYLPYEPSPKDREVAVTQGLSLSWDLPKAEPLRQQAAELEAQAAQLEAQATTEAEDHHRRNSRVVPRATISLGTPGGWEWDRGWSRASIGCSVNDGQGPVTFQVFKNANVEDTITLPDEQGRRSWGKTVDVFQGTRYEVRVDGDVLASEQLQIPEKDLVVKIGHIGDPLIAPVWR